MKNNTNVVLPNKLIAESNVICEINHIGGFTKYATTMIKWKNGIKKIVGLPILIVPGLDI